MAKKQQTDLDDFDFDDDIFGDDGGGFDDEGGSKPKKNRPVRTMVTSFAGGAREALMTPSSIKTLARSALPKGYGSAIDTGDDIFDTTRQLYNTAADELRPLAPLVRKAAGKIAKGTEGFVPEKLRKVLSDYAERGDSEYRAQTQEEQDQSQITEELGAIFKAQAEDEEKASKSERAERFLRYKVSDKQSSALIHQLAALNSKTSRLVAYQDNITYKYEQKTLENSYRMTFMLRDSLQVQRESLALLKEGLKDIVHNTSLPDYAKKSLHQSVKENFRDRLIGGVQSAAGNYVANFMGNVKKNLTGNLKNTLGDIVSGVQSVADMNDMMGDMGGMAEGGKLGMISNSLGGMAMEAMLPMLAMPFKKMFAKSHRAGRGGGEVSNLFSQIPQKMNRWAKSDSDVTTLWGQISQFMKDTVGTHSQETRLGQATILKGDAAVPFDNATRLSIVEIIPGYLSRIHQEIAMLRTGDKRRERLHFDKEKNEFVNFSDAVKSAQERMFKKETNFQTQKSVNEVLDLIDDGSLSPEERKQLAKGLMHDSTDLKVMDENFFSEKNAAGRYDPKLLPKLRAALAKSLHGDDGLLDQEKRQKLQEKFGGLSGNWRDPRLAGQVYYASGDRELIRALGITERKQGDAGSEDHLNYGSVFDAILNGDAIEGKKKEEVKPTWTTNKAKEVMGRYETMSEAFAEKVMSMDIVQTMTERIGDAIEDGYNRIIDLTKDDDDDDFIVPEGFTVVEDNGPPNVTREETKKAAKDEAATQDETVSTEPQTDKPKLKKNAAGRKTGFGLGKGTLSKKDMRELAEAAGHGEKFDAVMKQAEALKGSASAAWKDVKSAFSKGGLSGVFDLLKKPTDENDRTEGGDAPDAPERGFADGGYTGRGKRFEKAGTTHRNEIVFSEEDVERSGGVSAVEDIRKKGVDVAMQKRTRKPRAPKPKPKFKPGAKAAILQGKNRSWAGEKQADSTLGMLKNLGTHLAQEATQVYQEKQKLIQSEREKLKEAAYRDEVKQKAVTAAKDATSWIQGKLKAGQSYVMSVYDEHGRPLDSTIEKGKELYGKAETGVKEQVAKSEKLQALSQKASDVLSQVKMSAKDLTVDKVLTGLEQAAQQAKTAAEKENVIKQLTALQQRFGIDKNALFAKRDAALKSLMEMKDSTLNALSSGAEKVGQGVNALTTAGTAVTGDFKTLEEINANQLMLLDSIHQRLQGIEAISAVGTGADPAAVEKAKPVGRWDGPKALMKSLGSGAWATTKGFGSYLKGAFTLQGKALSFGVGSAWGLGSSIAGGIGNVITGKHRASDIFIKGGDPKTPTLLYKKMKEGKYIDVKTNKVIKNIDGITGPVREVSEENKDGNIVLTQEEYDKGLYDIHGKSLLKGAMRGLKNVGSAFMGYSGSVLALPFHIAKAGLNFATKALDLINEGEDVYLKGRKNPVMLNRDLKAGKFISAKTNKPIFSVKDVDGEIFTYDEGSKEKRIVITEQEAHTIPLVNWRGRPLRTLGQKGLGLVGGAASLAARSALGIAKGYAKVVGAVMGAGRDLVVGTAKGIGRFFNPKLGAGVIDPDGLQVQLLSDIFGLLNDRIPIPEKLRKGSWQEKFEKRDAEAAEDVDKKGKKDDEKGGLWGGLKNLFSKGKKGLLGLLGFGDDDDEDEDDDSLLDDAANAADVIDAGNDIRNGGGRGERRARRRAAKKRLKRMRRGRARGKGGMLRRLLGRGAGAATAAEGASVAGTAARGAGVAGAARGMGAALSGSKMIPIIGTAIGAAFAAKSIYDVQHDKNATDKEKREVTGGAVGGLAGTLAGAAIGQAAIPIPVLGAAIGGIAGYYGGDKLGSMLGGMGGKTRDRLKMAAAMAFPLIGIPAMFISKASHILKAMKNDPFSRLRMAQYGLSYKDTDKVEKIQKLEDICNDSLVTTGQGIQMDEKKLDVEYIFDTFGVDDGGFMGFFKKDNGDKRERFMKWFMGRFKIVFMSWKNAIKTAAGSKTVDLNSAWKELDAQQKKQLLQGLKVPPEVYNIDASPFPNEDIETGSGPVDAAYKEAMDEIEKQIGGASSAMGKAAIFLGEKAGKIANMMESTQKYLPLPLALFSKAGIKALRNIEKKAADINADAKPPEVGDYSAGQTLTALQSIRMKAYGLKKMHLDRINALSILERNVLKDVSTSGAASSYQKTGNEAYSKFCRYFGLVIDDDSQRKQWVEWFEARFLPVFLEFVSGARQALNSTTFKVPDVEKGLTADKKIAIAQSLIAAKRTKLLLLQLSIWSYTDSPWRDDDDLNDDSNSTKDNLKQLENEAKNVNLQEQTGQTKKQETPKQAVQGKAKKKEQTPSASTAAAPKTAAGSPSPQTSSANEQVNRGRDLLAEEDAAYWKSKGVDASNVNMANGRIESIGQRVTEPPASGGTMAQLTEPAGVGNAILPLISEVGKVVGVDPNLLATMANIESGLGRNVKASTSSASGLFQFISSTWNEYLGKYGAKFGIPSGTSPFDHRANALLGAQYTKDNLDRFKKALGRAPTDVDAYLMHFLGPGGWIKMAGASPMAVAASIAGKAAATANRAIFFKNGGQPRTVRELIEHVNGLLGKKRVSAGAAPPAKTPAGAGNTPAAKPDSKNTQAGRATNQPQAPKKPGMLDRFGAWVSSTAYDAVQGIKDAGTATGTWVGQHARKALDDAKRYAKDALAAPPAKTPAGVGNTLAAKAASFARSNALQSSAGKCALYIRQALDKAGFPAVRGNAYEYLYNGNMETLGYKRTNLQPGQAQCGDIMVVDRNADHKYGHIQIFDGQNWVSDFVQGTPWPYRKMPPWCIYRFEGGDTKAVDSDVQSGTASNKSMGPADIAQPAGLAQPGPSNEARDAEMQQRTQQDTYQNQMGERREQLRSDESAKLLAEQRDIQQQQLDTLVKIEGRFDDLIEAVQKIQVNGSTDTVSTAPTDPKDREMTGAKRTPPPYEARPNRSPLSVVRNRFMR